MALLERIVSMKQSGISDVQIMNSLIEEGISPREISEAISQSKIKAAVADDASAKANSNDLQPSIMTPTDNTQQVMSVPEAQKIKASAPIPQQYSPQQYATQDQYVQPQYYPQDQQGAYAGYDQAQYQQYPEQQGAYYPQQTIDLETVRDISHQQVEESLKKVREQLDLFSKTKTDLNFQAQDMENRLQKIETVIQDIQRAVLKKIGEYGEAISSISGEIKATQQSFSKVLNPLLDKQRGINHGGKEQENEAQEISEQESQEAKQAKNAKKSRDESRPRPGSKSSNSGSFEDYFR